MKVLYLGPYRQSNSDGQIARFFLKDITSQYKETNVISRPIYTDLSNSIIQKEIVFKTEHNSIIKNSKYDIFIQHMPIEHVQYMPDIAKKHFVFLILDNLSDFGLTKNNLRILNHFDKILVQSIKQKELILSSNSELQNKIEIFTPNINIEEYNKICQQKYSFANYTQSKKLYFIGNIDTDDTIIKKIIFAVYSASSKLTVPPLCVFFLDFNNQPDLNKLDNEIKKIRADFGLNDNQRKEMFIFKHFSENELIIAHNSCDIYLSFNEKQNLYLHEKYASLCNNRVLKMDDHGDCSIPYKNHMYNFSFGMSQKFISTEKLVSIIKEVL